MSDQIGLAVATEPQPVWTQKDIKNLLNDLAALRIEINRLAAADPTREWVELAALHDAEIKRLRAENADLTAKLTQVEEICQMQSANLQRYAASEFEHNRRAADLTAKLAAANAELHDLRIKCGLLQPEPDWSQAPEWVRRWAFDDDLQAYWLGLTQGSFE